MASTTISDSYTVNSEYPKQSEEMVSKEQQRQRH